MADLTYTSPIQLNVVPIPDGTVTFQFKLKGHKNRIKVNVDVNIYYKDPYIIGRIFLANSGIQSVYTYTEDKIHIMNFKIPNFQNRTQSHIHIGMEPLVGPYDRVTIEDVKIDVICPQQPIITPQASIAVRSVKPNIIDSSPTTILTRQSPGIWPTGPKIVEDIPKEIIKGPEIVDNEPRIAIASIVRDEERDNSLTRFLDCCQELEQYHKNIVYIFIEGDSSDRTFDILKSWVEKRNGSILEKMDRGYSPFHSNRDTRRTIYFAELRNRLIRLILSVPLITEVLIIDANYGWKGDLINILRDANADITAPLVVSNKNNDGKYVFYDIWAFRKNNKEFSFFYPYTEGLSDQPIEIDSVGGGYLVKRNVLESGVIYKGDTDSEHVSFCHQAKNMGFRIKINPKVYIRKGGFKE